MAPYYLKRTVYFSIMTVYFPTRPYILPGPYILPYNTLFLLSFLLSTSSVRPTRTKESWWGYENVIKYFSDIFVLWYYFYDILVLSDLWHFRTPFYDIFVPPWFYDILVLEDASKSRMFKKFYDIFGCNRQRQWFQLHQWPWHHRRRHQRLYHRHDQLLIFHWRLYFLYRQVQSTNQM